MNPKDIRKKTLDLCVETNCGHIPSAMSMVEILIAIYSIITPEDKFILSKGHGCMSWYAVMQELGMLMPQLRQHPDIDVNHNVECTTGSLGHGLPIGVGMALAKKIKKESGNIYVVMGDGECQEGTIWESALIASHQSLDNLKVIVDSNKLQAMDSVENIVSLGSLFNKFLAFNWFVSEIDGHNIEEIVGVLTYGGFSSRPAIIIANTIKGKGISFMENNAPYHAKVLGEEEIRKAYEELVYEESVR